MFEMYYMVYGDYSSMIAMHDVYVKSYEDGHLVYDEEFTTIEEAYDHYVDEVLMYQSIMLEYMRK